MCVCVCVCVCLLTKTCGVLKEKDVQYFGEKCYSFENRKPSLAIKR